MQIKATKMYHCTPISMAKIKNRKHQILEKMPSNWITHAIIRGNVKWYDFP